MAEKTVATQEVQKPTTESTRHQERDVAPPVDIYETQDGLVVLADVPGVSQEALDVRVDRNVLTIRGHAHHGIPGEAVYREYELVNFFRQFELSDKVQTPPDLVVKFQRLDIVDVILRLVLRPYLVYQREIKR